MSRDLSRSFGEASSQYAMFRPSYPASIYEFLTSRLDGERRRAVDLGAGSGQATRRLAELFTTVIAVEPDKRLTDEADFAANVAIKNSTAEEAAFPADSVDAVVCATAFHWMDQPLISARASKWLRPGGVFFPFAYDVFSFDGGAQKFFAAEFEKWRPFRDRRLDANYDYPEVLKRTGCFACVAALNEEMVCDMSAKEAAGLIRTASYASAYARETGAPEDYFRFIYENLAAFGDRLRVVFPIIGAIGRAGG